MDFFFIILILVRKLNPILLWIEPFEKEIIEGPSPRYSHGSYVSTGCGKSFLKKIKETVAGSITSFIIVDFFLKS